MNSEANQTSVITFCESPSPSSLTNCTLISTFTKFHCKVDPNKKDPFSDDLTISDQNDDVGNVDNRHCTHPSCYWQHCPTVAKHNESLAPQKQGRDTLDCKMCSLCQFFYGNIIKLEDLFRSLFPNGQIILNLVLSPIKIAFFFSFTCWLHMEVTSDC